MSFTYQDPSQPIEKRVQDLLGRMTLEEKVAQLYGIMPMAFMGPGGFSEEKMQALIPHGVGQISILAMFGGGTQIGGVAEGVNQIQKFLVEKTRLGVPAIFHNEALNGFVAPQAVNFPTALGLSATWSPELVERMTDVIRRQMVAVGMRQALSPVMDVARDPRWGRVHETYGEDPYLCGAMSVAFVRGLQGLDWQEGVIATGKHFLGYGLTEGGLNCTTTHVGERELYECFARPFEAAVREGGLASIMNSYSEINGIPCGASREVLTDLLRGKMGFQGFVVSDYVTVRRLVEQFHVARTLQEAGIQALEAGLDVELPNGEGYAQLADAVRKGLVSEELVNASVQRTLEWKFRLGLFEKPYADAAKVAPLYSDPQRVATHRALSRELANRSLVLLKNEERQPGAGRLLPLRKDLGTVAVIGPHADSVRALFAWYTYPAGVELMRAMMLAPDQAGVLGVLASGEGGGGIDAEAGQAMLIGMADLLAAPDIEAFIKGMYPAVSVLEAVKGIVSDNTTVLYEKGCDLTDPSTEGFAAAVQAAQKANVVIMVLGDRSGLIQATTGEGQDRASLALPGVQEQLLKTVAATGQPIVLVLINGRPLAVNWAAEHVPAILEAWYPGQEGGAAIAAALFGEVNPGGRLPVTIPRGEGQIPIYHYHKMGSGYRRPQAETLTHYTDLPITPLYPFGYGLSYTSFAYSNLRLSAGQVDSRGAIEVSCEVTNTGGRPGDEVVQLYLHDRQATLTRPVHELAGFRRIGLMPGATCTVTFKVEMRQLGFYNRQMRFVVEPGHVDVEVGSSSADIHLRGEFEITGEAVEVMGNRAFISRVSVGEQEGIGAAGRAAQQTVPPPAASPPAAPGPQPASVPPPSPARPAPPPAQPTPSTAEPETVGEVLVALAQRLDGKRPDVTMAIKFDVEGEGIYRLLVEAGRCRVEPGEGVSEATLRMKAADGLKIMAGKMNPMVAMATRKLRVEGNMQKLMIFQDMLK